MSLGTKAPLRTPKPQPYKVIVRIGLPIAVVQLSVGALYVWALPAILG
jgi:hypothetical protein